MTQSGKHNLIPVVLYAIAGLMMLVVAITGLMNDSYLWWMNLISSSLFLIASFSAYKSYIHKKKRYHNDR